MDYSGFLDVVREANHLGTTQRVIIKKNSLSRGGESFEDELPECSGDVGLESPTKTTARNTMKVERINPGVTNTQIISDTFKGKTN